MTKFVFLSGTAGNNNEKWGPYSLDTGIGGSESCLIHLARELAKTCYVEVFSNSGLHRTCDNDAWWVDWSEFERNPQLNTAGAIVVSWRQPHLLVGIKGKQNWVYDHNGLNHPDPTPEQWQWIDKFVCLNKWHADQYIARGAPREKVVIGGTAINYTPFDWVAQQGVQRIPFRAFAHFHPGRGMHELLHYWEAVHDALPQATLQTMWWDESVFSNFPAIPELGILPYKKGGPYEVALELSQSQVFAYPAVGTETAPLTVIEAQAAGAFPVVIPVGGMNQVMVDGLQCHHVNFANNLIWMLRECEYKDKAEQRQRMMSGVRQQFNWASVAQRWLDLAR